MHMIDGLAAIRAGVEHDPVTALADALSLSHLGRVCQDLAQQVFLLAINQLGQIRMMLARDH